MAFFSSFDCLNRNSVPSCNFSRLCALTSPPCKSNSLRADLLPSIDHQGRLFVSSQRKRKQDWILPKCCKKVKTQSHCRAFPVINSLCYINGRKRQSSPEDLQSFQKRKRRKKKPPSFSEEALSFENESVRVTHVQRICFASFSSFIWASSIFNLIQHWRKYMINYKSIPHGYCDIKQIKNSSYSQGACTAVMKQDPLPNPHFNVPTSKFSQIPPPWILLSMQHPLICPHWLNEESILTTCTRCILFPHFKVLHPLLPLINQMNQNSVPNHSLCSINIDDYSFLHIPFSSVPDLYLNPTLTVMDLILILTSSIILILSVVDLLFPPHPHQTMDSDMVPMDIDNAVEFYDEDFTINNERF